MEAEKGDRNRGQHAEQCGSNLLAASTLSVVMNISKIGWTTFNLDRGTTSSYTVIDS